MKHMYNSDSGILLKTNDDKKAQDSPIGASVCFPSLHTKSDKYPLSVWFQDVW